MRGYSRQETYQLYAWDWNAVISREQIQELAKSVDDVGHHLETKHRRNHGKIIEIELSNTGTTCRGQKLIYRIGHDISDSKRIDREREELIKKLQE